MLEARNLSVLLQVFVEEPHYRLLWLQVFGAGRCRELPQGSAAESRHPPLLQKLGDGNFRVLLQVFAVQLCCHLLLWLLVLEAERRHESLQEFVAEPH